MAPDQQVKPCRCNCGPTCGGRSKCDLPYLKCIQEHWVRDCDHEFEGWKEFADGRGGTTVCKHCGLESMAHDMRVGP